MTCLIAVLYAKEKQTESLELEEEKKREFLKRDLIYMWDLINKINQQTKQKRTHRYRQQMTAVREEESWKAS